MAYPTSRLGFVWLGVDFNEKGATGYQHVREITIMSDVSGFMSKLCTGESAVMPCGPECRTTARDGQCRQR